MGRLTCVLVAVAYSARVRAADDPLRSLRQEHPRLLATDRDLDRTRILLQQNAQARRIHSDLVKEADKMLAAPVLEYRLAGPRLALQSQRCLERVYTLAFLYRLDGKTPYLDRAVRELRAAAGFKGWSAGPFADRADLMQAFAIGYDWLYPALGPDDRSLLRAAMLEKGIDPALAGYDRQTTAPVAHRPWNAFASSGIVLSALALAEDEPEKSRAVLSYEVDALGRALNSFGADGGWTEGRFFLHDVMRNAVLVLAAFESALGSDFGLSSAKGLEKAGRFRIYATGPAGGAFEYADASDMNETAPYLFWMSRRFYEPVYAWYEAHLLESGPNPDPLDLIWYQTETRSLKQDSWPLNAVFSGIQAAFLRSAWEDPNAIFVGLKGGDNKTQPSRRDLGSFVLDAGGVRWALDLGRARLGLHNSIVIDDENQDSRAEAPVTHPVTTAQWTTVEADLSKVYPQKVKQFHRRIGLFQGQQVVIQDTLRADQPVEAIWGMLTDAEVTLNGQTAELKKGGWTLTAEILSPRHAVFDLREVGPASLGTPGPPVRRLMVRLGEKVSDLDLKVTLTPYRTGQARPNLPPPPVN